MKPPFNPRKLVESQLLGLRRITQAPEPSKSSVESSGVALMNIRDRASSTRNKAGLSSNRRIDGPFDPVGKSYSRDRGEISSWRAQSKSDNRITINPAPEAHDESTIPIWDSNGQFLCADFGCSWEPAESRRSTVHRPASVGERREWDRLPISIPFFVRGGEDSSAEFLEFAPALNLSAGGVLLAIRRYVERGTEISLEVPVSLMHKAQLPHPVSLLRATVLRCTPDRHYFLLGLRFKEPLIDISSTQLARTG